MSQVKFKFAERVQWSQRVRGAVAMTEKEEADRRAIGGLRDASDSVSRLHMVASFGRRLSTKLRELIMFNEDSHNVADTLDQSWISTTMAAIGSEGAEAGPPADAISAVKELLSEMCSLSRSDNFDRLTNVDAPLLEAWRKAASHPDTYIAKWMVTGAPAGILNPIPDPGIFPTCSKPATSEPLDLHCDFGTFQNYPNVEASEITEAELSSHWEKGHIIGFDSYEDLSEFVHGKPILSKLGLILKTRNGVTKAMSDML